MATQTKNKRGKEGTRAREGMRGHERTLEDTRGHKKIQKEHQIQGNIHHKRHCSRLTVLKPVTSSDLTMIIP